MTNAANKVEFLLWNQCSDSTTPVTLLNERAIPFASGSGLPGAGWGSLVHNPLNPTNCPIIQWTIMQQTGGATGSPAGTYTPYVNPLIQLGSYNGATNAIIVKTD